MYFLMESIVKTIFKEEVFKLVFGLFIDDLKSILRQIFQIFV